jgi:hypothetical protein
LLYLNQPQKNSIFSLLRSGLCVSARLWCLENCPQGLKPLLIYGCYGTAKAVPLTKTAFNENCASTRIALQLKLRFNEKLRFNKNFASKKLGSSFS